MTAYSNISRELAEHHAAQLRHQEQELRDLNTLLEVNDHQLKQANATIREMREELMQANAWMVLLPIMGLCAGIVITALCRSWL